MPGIGMGLPEFRVMLPYGRWLDAGAQTGVMTWWSATDGTLLYGSRSVCVPVPELTQCITIQPKKCGGSSCNQTASRTDHQPPAGPVGKERTLTWPCL
jgi:hypothetical protein